MDKRFADSGPNRGKPLKVDGRTPIILPLRSQILYDRVLADKNNGIPKGKIGSTKLDQNKILPKPKTRMPAGKKPEEKTVEALCDLQNNQSNFHKQIEELKKAINEAFSDEKMAKALNNAQELDAAARIMQEQGERLMNLFKEPTAKSTTKSDGKLEENGVFSIAITTITVAGMLSLGVMYQLPPQVFIAMALFSPILGFVVWKAIQYSEKVMDQENKEEKPKK